jgi:hypothetical protein
VTLNRPSIFKAGWCNQDDRLKAGKVRKPIAELHLPVAIKGLGPARPGDV